MHETYLATELDASRLAGFLGRLPRLAVAVIGDFFLDKYLVIDRSLSEVSLETGLEAYQVVAKRSSPGAAGTVTSNLRALGVGTVHAIGVVGDDGEGYELRQGLRRSGVLVEHLVSRSDCFTPTYTKPMVREALATEREIQRMDIKNRGPLSGEVEDAIIAKLEECVEQVDGVMVADQVQERNRGVITDRVRQRLGELGERYPEKVFFVDSRTRIGEYRHLIVKPNQAEAAAAFGAERAAGADLTASAELGLELSRRTGRPVYVTLSENGTLVCTTGGAGGDRIVRVPAVRVTGEIDPVGAGDSTAAGMVCALCAGASPEEAGLVGNLVASITIQQIGTTGTASPAQVLARLGEAAEQARA